MRFLAFILLASPALAQDVPYYNRAMDQDQDRGALNQNMRDLADRNRDLVNGSDIPQNTCFGDESLCVDATNYRVGIGTDTPTAGLDVRKDAVFATTVTFNGPVIYNGAFASSNTISLSSHSYIYQGAALGVSDFPACVSGSTVAITLATSSWVKYTVSANVYSNGATWMKLWVLRDSDIRAPYTAGTGGVAVRAVYTPGASGDVNGSFVYSENLAPGTHTFCTTCYAAGGSINFGSAVAAHESLGGEVMVERLP